MKLKVGFLCFDEMEILDFAGPLEVFSVANELSNYALFDIALYGYASLKIICRNGLSINTDCLWSPDLSDVDILIVPGGDGTRPLLKDNVLLNWVKCICASPQVRVLSVCSGALVLAAAGALKGMQVTTHSEVLTELQALSNDFKVIKSRYCDNGNIITAAGISAGIDASIYFVEKYFGQELAKNVNRYMEYSYVETH